MLIVFFFRALTRELPLNTPYGSKATLIVQSLGAWQIIADDCVNQLRPAVFQVVENLLSKYFGRYSAGPLRNICG